MADFDPDDIDFKAEAVKSIKESHGKPEGQALLHLHEAQIWSLLAIACSMPAATRQLSGGVGRALVDTDGMRIKLAWVVAIVAMIAITWYTVGTAISEYSR